MNSAGLHADSNETRRSFSGRTQWQIIKSESPRTGRPRWDVRVRRRGHPLITGAFDTKADGETWARGVERDLDLGQYKTPPKATRTLGDTTRELNAKPRKIVSQHDREQQLTWWSEHYGKTPLRIVSTGLLNEALRLLATETIGSPRSLRKRSPQTVRHYAIAMSKYLSLAVVCEWLDMNPMRRVEMPLVSRPEAPSFSAQSRFQKFGDACKPHHRSCCDQLDAGHCPGVRWGPPSAWQGADPVRGRRYTEAISCRSRHALLRCAEGGRWNLTWRHARWRRLGRNTALTPDPCAGNFHRHRGMASLERAQRDRFLPRRSCGNRICARTPR